MMSGMKRILRMLVLLAGTLMGLGGFVSTAFAQTCAPTQDPRICVEVTGAPTVVYSISENEKTFWTITVQIRNGASNTLNRVRVKGSLLTTALPGTAVQFVDPATGNTSPNPVYLNNPSPSISCTLTSEIAISCGGIGTSIPAGQTLSFNLMSSTPLTEGQISFNWEAWFAEGNATSDGADNGAAQAVGRLTTTVVPPSGDSANASFPASGGTLATAPDSFTTKIVIPATGKSTSATITETKLEVDPLRPCNSFSKCYESFVSIPGFIAVPGGLPLAINLYMDKLNIRKGAKIESVLIYYTGDVFVNELVDLCPGFGTAPVPLTNGMPCISKRIYYKPGRPKGISPLDGDFYWEIINTKNGRLTLF